MAKEDKYSLRDLKLDFPTDEACIEFIYNALHSRQCSCGGTYKLLKRRRKDGLSGRQFQCSKCRYQIAPAKGTIFEKSSTKLTLWFHALWVFSNAKSGVSAKELERQLGVTYKTAWRILAMIRKALPKDQTKLKGRVEMDETYYGGKGRGGRNNKELGEVMRKKAVIAGAIERKGPIHASVLPNAGAASLGEFIRENIEKEDTHLLTDESNRYDKVAKGYYRRAVNHSKKQFVRGEVHVNTLESFWSHFKRSVKGTHKTISKKHLQSYLDGFAWHYNNRHNDSRRFASLLGALLRGAAD